MNEAKVYLIMHKIATWLLLLYCLNFPFCITHLSYFKARDLLALESNETNDVESTWYCKPPCNCTRPAIEQFPEPLMGNTARKNGGLVIHIFVATYMFIGLAIVCDDYFVPALDKIADGESNFWFYNITIYVP